MQALTDMAQLQQANAELRRKLDDAERTIASLTTSQVDPVRAGDRPFRALFEGALDGMVLADDEGRYVDANPAACALYQLSHDELIGRSVADFMTPGFDLRVAWTAFLREGRMSGEFPLVRLDGVRREIEYSARANIVPGVHLAVMRDVTDRNVMRTTHRASEARFRAMIEKSQDGITLLGPDVRTLYQSPAVERLFGYSKEEAEQIVWTDFVAEEDVPKLGEALERLLAAPLATVSFEFRMRHRDGRMRWVELSAKNFLHDPDIGALVTNFRDITERRLIEQALRESEQRYRRIVENADEGIWTYDASGTITFMNPRMAQMLGCTPEEAVGQSTLTFIPEDDHVEARARLERRSLGISEGGEFRLRRRDGVDIWVSVRAAPLLDAQGRFESALALVTDISDQRVAAAALRRVEDQLRQSQKMEAIGSLAGGVAHDFNNLLSVILSYAELMSRGLPAADPLRLDIAEVAKAATRASELTRQLLAFSRQQIMRPTVLDVNQTVLGVERMLRRILGEDVHLSLLMSAEAGKAHSDAGQIEQVLMNLVVNARDAMPGGGNLTIETANVTLDEGYAAEHPSVVPGAYVMIAVTDTGTGMDRATQERIFEPFFTTKDHHRGTGLGLSTVYGIVQQSGGHIWVYSEPGKGTTFKVYLPRTDRDLPPEPSTLVEPVSLRGTETILLVEDEAAVRTIVRTILRKSGYHVLEAQNGGEAFLLCEQFTAKIHLLLTDVVMPRMSGRQLAERLLQLRPDLSVLYVSGYTENTIVHHGVLDAGIEFLQKPITPDALLRKVRRVLDAALGRSVKAPA